MMTVGDSCLRQSSSSYRAISTQVLEATVCLAWKSPRRFAVGAWPARSRIGHDAVTSPISRLEGACQHTATATMLPMMGMVVIAFYIRKSTIIGIADSTHLTPPHGAGRRYSRPPPRFHRSGLLAGDAHWSACFSTSRFHDWPALLLPLPQYGVLPGRSSARYARSHLMSRRQQARGRDALAVSGHRLRYDTIAAVLTCYRTFITGISMIPPARAGMLRRHIERGGVVRYGGRRLFSYSRRYLLAEAEDTRMMPPTATSRRMLGHIHHEAGYDWPLGMYDDDYRHRYRQIQD